jgi:hypothetical protein
MKTTSYEISKQLNYAGFKAKSDTIIHDPSNPITGERYASFCLETILDVLPKQKYFYFKVSKEIGKYELEIWYDEGKVFIGYQIIATFDKRWTLEKKENESLADTAARLWLKIREEWLV